MLTCNFFSSLSIPCSIILKDAKSLLEFSCDSVDFISIILQGGVIWVHWDFHRNLIRVTKIEIILQANGCKGTRFCSCFSVFRIRHKD